MPREVCVPSFALRRLYALAALLSIGLSSEAVSQDAQYWTVQYGNEARLLSGAVIGSVFDLSAVYYNPGRLALVTDPRLVLAGNVFRFSQIKLEDAFGTDEDLTNTKVGGVPSLFAGELRFKFLGDHRLAYSFLTRQDFDLNVTERLDVRPPDLMDPAFDLFAAGFVFNQNMDEYWAGLTWAHTLGQKLGLGITTFVAVRDQKTREQTLAQAVDTAGNAGIALQQEGYNYQHWRLLWKIGLGGNLGDHWEVGVSLTTPSIGLFGSGKAFYDETLITQDLGGSGTSFSDVTTSTQQDLPVDYKSPLSVGVGGAYSKGPARFHASAEWFDGVPVYDVLAPAPVLLPDSSMAAFGLTQELTSVTNVAVGAEYQFSPKLTGYAGFRTDQSAIDNASTGNTSLSIWDIYHVSAGGTFSIGASDFTLGGIMAWGSDVTNSGIELIPGGGGAPIDPPDQIDVKFFRVTFILGFSIGF
jgi:hypothetical protein